VKATRAFRYRLPVEGGGVREGVLLEDAASGRWGEAAPLPGWSAESLDEVVEAVRGGVVVGGPPSLRCALEALDGVGPLRHARVPINALLRGGRESVIQRGMAAIARGCGCLKIKTGELDVREIGEVVRVLSDAAGGGVVFRIDPNRAWSVAVTLRVAGELRGLPVEYLEEPVRGGGALREVIGECPVGIALDETLREIEPDGLADYAGAVALVMKPTLLGGFGICRRFAEAGAGMRAVVSACHESGVGIALLGRFAASLPGNEAAGLDTYAGLLDDVLCARLDFTDFVFRADEPIPDVDRSKLVAL
jgi:o-succinylbenzoate synthase